MRLVEWGEWSSTSEIDYEREIYETFFNTTTRVIIKSDLQRVALLLFSRSLDSSRPLVAGRPVDEPSRLDEPSPKTDSLDSLRRTVSLTARASPDFRAVVRCRPPPRIGPPAPRSPVRFKQDFEELEVLEVLFT